MQRNFKWFRYLALKKREHDSLLLKHSGSETFFQRLKYGKGVWARRWLHSGEPDKQHQSPVVKGRIKSVSHSGSVYPDVTWWKWHFWHNPWHSVKSWERHQTNFSRGPSYIIVILNTAKIIKTKEKSRNCHSQEDPKGSWNLSGNVSWMGLWRRKKGQ